MTARRLVVIGGGEHARVVIETARTRPDQFSVEGFVDPDPCVDTVERLGVPRLGDDADILARSELPLVVLGIGAVGISDARRAIVDRYTAVGARFATVVHSHAWVSPTARLGDGCVVFGGAIVQTGAEIGAHAVIGTGAVIEHDVSLGAFVQAGPGVVIGGGARVGEGSYLGLGSRVRDHVTIGAAAMVAMGAVVTGAVADRAVVVGLPARPRS